MSGDQDAFRYFTKLRNEPMLNCEHDVKIEDDDDGRHYLCRRCSLGVFIPVESLTPEEIAERDND